MARSATQRQPIVATIWDFLRGNLHLNPGAAAGVEGNWITESGLRSTAYNPGENAHGYAQWEGGRWSGPGGLQAFAAARGQSPTNPLVQLQFFAAEIRARGQLGTLRQITDPTQAAAFIQSQYEVSDPSTLGAREANARAVYASASKYGTPHPLKGVGAGTGGGTGGFQGFGPGDLIPGFNLIPGKDKAVSGFFDGLVAGLVKIAFSAGGVGLIVLGVNHAVKAS